MSVVGLARGTSELRHALHSRAMHFNRCYRWAKHGGRLGEATVTASMDVDSFGVVANVKADGPPKLATCVAEGLQSMRVDNHTPRNTHIRLPIAFRPSPFGDPQQRPERRKLCRRRLPRPSARLRPVPFPAMS